MLVICSSKIGRETIVPQKSIKRIIVGNKQRCLTCNVFVLRIGKLGKFANLQLRNKPYKHAENCPQIGRF